MPISTEENRLIMNDIFLDTSFAIAFVSPKNQYYEIANAWSKKIEKLQTPVITTQAVPLEIENALSKSSFRSVGMGLLDCLESDSNTTIISLTNYLYDKAFELFRDRDNKEWGLVDCLPFVVMRERGMNSALTVDEHFVQAGFRALLRED